MCLAQGHNTVTLVEIKSLDSESDARPLGHHAPNAGYTNLQCIMIKHFGKIYSDMNKTKQKKTHTHNIMMKNLQKCI